MKKQPQKKDLRASKLRAKKELLYYYFSATIVKMHCTEHCTHITAQFTQTHKTHKRVKIYSMRFVIFIVETRFRNTGRNLRYKILFLLWWLECIVASNFDASIMHVTAGIMNEWCHHASDLMIALLDISSCFTCLLTFNTTHSTHSTHSIWQVSHESTVLHFSRRVVTVLIVVVGWTVSTANYYRATRSELK